MNTQTDTKTESRSGKNNGAPASIVWFEIPVDNVERARTFYGKLFGWKIEPFPGPKPYWHIDTGGADATPDGGMMERQCPEHSFTNYVGVPSVEEAAAKVEKLGGKICMERRPCRRWVTSLFVRTRRTIPLRCGSGTKRRNSCPEEERSFVVTSKTERKPKI